MANTAEAIVFGALKSLVANGDGTYRCYPDVGPDSVTTPYITFQQVGGQSPNALTGVTDIQNSRMQVNVWAATRIAAVDLMQSVIAALTTDSIRGVTIGAPVSTYEPDTKLFGSRQDVSIWFYP